MKKMYVLLYGVLCSVILNAQVPAKDTIVPSRGNVKNQLKEIKDKKITLQSDSAGNEPIELLHFDSTKTDRYGDLLNDDTAYNKKSPFWKPALQVVTENTMLNLVDRSILHLEFAKVDFNTWRQTTRAGFPWSNKWEWDQDRFGNNFLSHPMTGNFYYNAARSNSYNFWQSAPLVFAGSYMWKIFGENGKPEREDLLNTTFDGILLGEVLYRLSSNILDDRTRGPKGRSGKYWLG